MTSPQRQQIKSLSPDRTQLSLNLMYFRPIDQRETDMPGAGKAHLWVPGLGAQNPGRSSAQPIKETTEAGIVCAYLSVEPNRVYNHPPPASGGLNRRRVRFLPQKVVPHRIDPDGRKRPTWANKLYHYRYIKDAYSNTSLLPACASGDKAVIKLLLSAGLVDVNKGDDIQRNEPASCFAISTVRDG